MSMRMDQLLGALCRSVPFLTGRHIYVRYRTCPFELIETYVPREGKILDLGCGFGFFDLWMKRCSGKRDILALDWQEERISLANGFAREQGTRVEFLRADYSLFDLGVQETVLLIDTLYLMPVEQQKAFLTRCAESLKPGGVLLVKEMDTAPRIKYLFLLFQEFLATKLANFNGTQAIHIIGKKEMEAFLAGLGLGVEIIALDRGYCYPHILYRCVKK